MNKKVAHYLFGSDTLYQFPHEVKRINVSPEEEEPTRIHVPTTAKKHVWCFGEKPVDEKRELMVKLLQACQLKGADVEFYFTVLPIEEYLRQNVSIKTLLVFGAKGGDWPADWPTYQINNQLNTQVLYAYTLDELIQNQQNEKRNFWEWLKKLYRLT